MNKKGGFTLVELLIVIVVIAILAAISVVAYSGIQQRARDAQRQNDIAAIAKALELYYIENGRYPLITGGSTVINGSWATTADGSWSKLTDALAPYASGLGRDPVSTAGAQPLNTTVTGYNYAYFGSGSGSTYCSAQVYILVYRLEGAAQQQRLDNCPGTSLGPYGAGTSSNYRVVK